MDGSEREGGWNGIQVVCREMRNEQSRSKEEKANQKLEENREDRMPKPREETSRHRGRGESRFRVLGDSNFYDHRKVRQKRVKSA